MIYHSQAKAKVKTEKGFGLVALAPISLKVLKEAHTMFCLVKARVRNKEGPMNVKEFCCLMITKICTILELF